MKCNHKLVVSHIENWKYIYWICRCCGEVIKQNYNGEPVTKAMEMNKGT
jgi:hypothetical protein